MADSVLTLTKDVDTMGPALEAGRVKVTTGAVWLPPEPRDYERHRNQQQGRNGENNMIDSDDEDYDDPSSQHQLEDPSMYFLRGNRSFTLHALRVPMLMVELYSAIFFIGMIGDVTATFGPRLVYVLPVAFLPLLIVWFTVPIGAFMLAVLSSMGSRLGEDDLAEAFLSSGEWRELLGDEVAMDEHGVDNEYGKDPNANDGNACIYCEERITEIRELEEKVEQLERLCRKFGLKTGEYRGIAKHSHHQDIEMHSPHFGGGASATSAPSASAFDTHFSPTTSSGRQGSGTKNKNKDFFWPSNFSEAGSVQESNHNNNNDDNDSDFAGMQQTTSSNFDNVNNNSKRSFVAPDNVQAASFQDHRQRELGRSFQADRQLQRQLNNNNNNNRRVSIDTNNTTNRTPKSTTIIASPQQQGRLNLPLLSTSAIASPMVNNTTTATSPAAATSSRNYSSRVNNNNNNSVSFASPTSALSSTMTPRQHQGGDAMMKNINSALRGVL